MGFVRNLLLFLAMKEFGKSVELTVITMSSVNYFWDSVYTE